MDESSQEHLFDWVSARALGQDGDVAVQGLSRYTEHLLKTGLGEDAVYDCLLASGLSAESAATLIREAAASLPPARGRRPSPAVPLPVLGSGPYDPDFSLASLPPSTQLIALEARKAERWNWILGMIVLFLAMLPFLLIGITAVWSAFE